MERKRFEERHENDELVTGFREVRTEKIIDSKTGLEFDFVLQSIDIDVINNKMSIRAMKYYYDNEGNEFKKERFNYVDYDRKAKYEIVENIEFDNETGEEIITLVSETKIEDEFLPVTNWDAQLGESISLSIINRIKELNNL